MVLVISRSNPTDGMSDDVFRAVFLDDSIDESGVERNIEFFSTRQSVSRSIDRYNRMT